jgi:hypothetical protein
VVEVLLPGPGLRDALRAGRSAAELRARAVSEGLVTLTTRLGSLARAGTITADEAGRTLA